MLIGVDGARTGQRGGGTRLAVELLVAKLPNRCGCQGSPPATAAGGVPARRVLDSRSDLENGVYKSSTARRVPPSWIYMQLD